MRTCGSVDTDCRGGGVSNWSQLPIRGTAATHNLQILLSDPLGKAEISLNSLHTVLYRNHNLVRVLNTTEHGIES